MSWLTVALGQQGLGAPGSPGHGGMAGLCPPRSCSSRSQILGLNNISEGETHPTAPRFHLMGYQPGTPCAAGSTPQHLRWLLFCFFFFLIISTIFLKRACRSLGSSTAHNPHLPGLRVKMPAGPARPHGLLPDRGAKPDTRRRGLGRALRSPPPLRQAAPPPKPEVVPPPRSAPQKSAEAPVRSK